MAMGWGLEFLIPFAAGYEIIRQKKKELTLIGPISDIQFDQLIGAGCVKKVVIAWVGNVAAGLAIISGGPWRKGRLVRCRSKNIRTLPSVLG